MINKELSINAAYFQQDEVIDTLAENKFPVDSTFSNDQLSKKQDIHKEIYQ